MPADGAVDLVAEAGGGAAVLSTEQVALAERTVLVYGIPWCTDAAEMETRLAAQARAELGDELVCFKVGLGWRQEGIVQGDGATSCSDEGNSLVITSGMSINETMLRACYERDKERVRERGRGGETEGARFASQLLRT